MAFLRMAAVAALLFSATTASAEEIVVDRIASQAADFRVVRVLDDLAHPWSMGWLDDATALIALRNGQLYRWRTGSDDLTRIANMPSVAHFGQGGLYDVKPAPDFQETGMIVMAYAAASQRGAATRVAEARLAGDGLSQFRVIFEAAPASPSARHFGGRLRFAANGDLFVSFGDRGERDRAQDASDPAGAIYRFPKDGKPEMFTMGHRNAQGMAIHPKTGDIWVHEHGPRGGDEVNRLIAGANYGWPIVTYGEEYSGGKIADAGTAPGFEAPLHYWVPSIAPSGMAFYQGDAFPGWRDSLFVGALRSRLVARLTVTGDKVVAEERLLQGQIGRIREVSVGPDGLVYLLTDEPDGGLYRLEPR